MQLVAHSKVKMYNKGLEVSAFNSACSLLFVTAHITQEQAAAVAYNLKKNFVKFHLGNLGFSGRVFSSVGFFFNSCFCEIVSCVPFTPCLYELPVLYLWESSLNSIKQLKPSCFP